MDILQAVINVRDNRTNTVWIHQMNSEDITYTGGYYEPI